MVAFLALAGCGLKSSSAGGVGAGDPGGPASGGGGAAGTGGTSGAIGGTAGMAGLGGAGVVGGPWSKRFGSTGRDVGIDVAVDPAGNIVLTGYFTGTVDFGGGDLTGPGRSIFVAKFAPAGTHLWSKRFGGTGETDYGGSVATDAAGNVLVTGAFGTSVDFGGGRLTSAGDRDVFVAKFSPDGGHLWSKRFGSTLGDLGWGIAADGAGNVIVSGYFTGTADFGGGNVTSAGGNDIFVAKFAPNGEHLWSRGFGSAAHDASWDVVADGAGNVVLTGDVAGMADFGGGVLTPAGKSDIFVAKFSPSGSYLWSKLFGGANFDFGWGLATDLGGSVVLTGAFSEAVDFGGGGLLSAGDRDTFVAKFASDGSHLWSKPFGGVGPDRGNALATDSAGSILFTGYFSEAVDFGGGVLTSAGAEDLFVVRFAADGSHQWSARIGGIGGDQGWSITADVAGSALFTGHFSNAVDSGGGTLVSAGERDVFVARTGP